MGKFLLDLIVAGVLAALGYLYFGSVLPPYGAAILAIVLFVIGVMGPLIGSKRGVGLRVLARAGLPLLVFPGIAWALAAVVHGQALRVALAATAAVWVAALASGHGTNSRKGGATGQGGDGARLSEVLVAALLPIYAIAYAIVDGSKIALAVSALAVAAICIVARIAIVWPGRHERVFVVAAGWCTAIAAVFAITSYI